MKKIHSLKLTTVMVGLLVAKMAAALPVRSGTADIGGGGAGVVCRDTQGRVRSARLLDLYEGQLPSSKLQIPEIRMSKEEALEPQEAANAALERLSFGTDNHQFESASPQGYLRHVINQRQDIEHGVTIARPMDLGSEVAIRLPVGCQIESIGYREKVGMRMQLSIVSDIYLALSPLHRTAFWVHEALYSFYQSHYGKVSAEIGTAKIRHLTAVLFSKNAGLDQLVEASRFLFVLENGLTYVNSAHGQARLEFVGQTDALDLRYDNLSAGSEAKFFCAIDERAPVVSHLERYEKSPDFLKLTIDAKSACDSEVVVNGLRGNLVINGQEAGEVLQPSKFDLVFLKDQTDYENFVARARYPFLDKK